MKKCVLLLLVLCLFSSVSFSEVSLPRVFSDHMVLQREMQVPVWGTADAGEAVAVEFGGQRLTTEADADGKWMVKLSAMSAGGPFDLVVQSKNTLTFSNVLVGEVWICSGQSNMEFPLERLEGARDEVKNATNPEIRLFLAPKTISGKPQDYIDASWQVCHPHFADNFSAVAYTFAKYVHREIGVPIGLIQSAYGGSKIEPWMTVEALRQVPSLGSRVAYVEGSDAVHRGAIGDVLAVAEIEGESVVVSSEHVSDPIAVRLGWSNVAEPNLSNREGLPASPFRTDSW